MTTNAEIKRAILKGVLEENLGLPKSSGSRSRVSHPAAASAPRNVQRARWSPIPLLITVFLFASGAAFPRLAGDLGVVVSTPPLQAPDQAVAEGTHSVEAVPLVEDAGQADDAAEQRPAPGDAEMGLSYVPESRAEPPDTVGPLTDYLAFGEPSLEVVTEPVHTVYEQMIDDGSIPVADLFGLKVSTIVIDPGHGGVDPGATGPNGVMEKDLTLDIARRLRDKLAPFGNHRVLLTREEDVKIPLRDRVEFARKHTADLFISIHFNSLPVESDNLVETFYFGPHADTRILALAEKENAGSGYSVGDFRQVIARISDTLKTQESKALATLLHRHLYGNLKRENVQLSNAGIKTAPFVVLLGSDVPSVLAEVSCLSNEQEARNLANAEYRDRIAEYLRDGILQYLDQERNTQQHHIATGELNHVAKQ